MQTIRTTRRSRRFAIGGFFAAALVLGGTLSYGNQPDMNRGQQASLYSQDTGNSAGGPVHTDPSGYLLRTLPILPNPTGYLITQPPVEPDSSAYLF